MWSNNYEEMTIIHLGKKGLYGEELQEKINAVSTETAITEIDDFILSSDGAEKW